MQCGIILGLVLLGVTSYLKMYIGGSGVSE